MRKYLTTKQCASKSEFKIHLLSEPMVMNLHRCLPTTKTTKKKELKNQIISKNKHYMCQHFLIRVVCLKQVCEERQVLNDFH